MGLTKTSMGYRADYIKKTERKLPKGITIHHINHNRLDGNILNLVAIPERLHVRYHQLYPQFTLTHDMLQLPVNIDEMVNMVGYAERLLQFMRVRQELLKYVQYRNELLDKKARKHLY